MTTTVVKTIGSGGDYSSLQAWNDAAPANLTTADQIWQGNCLAGFSPSGGTSTLLTIGGSTSDSTRYKVLTTAAGASFRDNANVLVNALRFNASNGVGISASVYAGRTLVVNEAYARISKLQVENTSTQSGSACFAVTAANVRIDGCIIEGQGSVFSGAALYVSGAGSNLLLTNSLVLGRRAGPTTVIALDGPSNVALGNVTAGVPSDLTTASYILGTNYSHGHTAKNCAFFGGQIASNNGDWTFTTCRSEHASPPTGVTQIAYDTTTGSGFQATTDATRDFRIKSTSAMKDVGTTDSTNAAIDISGTARPAGTAYDIGAWEYAVPPFAAVFSSSSTVTANLTTGRVPLTPAWATGAINAWMAIPNSTQTGTAADVLGDGGVSVDKRLSFCGMGLIKGVRPVLAASGGHTDYHGNEVVSIDLSANSPAWALDCTPSSPLPNPLTSSDSLYGADGKPASSHTYWKVEYVPQVDRVFIPYQSFPGDGGGACSHPWVNAWNVTTKTWDAAETWTDGTSTTCMDAYNVLWVAGTDGYLRKFDARGGAPGVWTTVGATGDTTGGAPMCDDPVRGRLVVFCSGNGFVPGATTFQCFDKTTAALTVQTIAASAAKTEWDGLATTVANSSLEYDPWNDRFLVFAGSFSNKIFTLTPPSSGTVWTMGYLGETGAGSLPACVGGGSYNRFRVSRDLQGIVYMPAGNASMMYLRLAGSPAGGISGTGASTQAPNIAAASGAVGISSAASSTQHANTDAGSGAVAVAGAGAATQAHNTGAAAGSVSDSGTVSATQAVNASTATGAVSISGAAAASQAGNTTTASGAVAVSGTAAATQAANTAAASGTVGAAGAITGTAAAAQQPNTASAAGSVGISGTAAAGQQLSTSASAGAVAISGASAATQSRHTAQATGQVITPGGEAATHGFIAIRKKRIWSASK